MNDTWIITKGKIDTILRAIERCHLEEFTILNEFGNQWSSLTLQDIYEKKQT